MADYEQTKVEQSSSAGESSDEDDGGDEEVVGGEKKKKKKGLKEKIKEKLGGDEKKDEEKVVVEHTEAVAVSADDETAVVIETVEEQTVLVAPEEEKKGFLEKFKEKLPGGAPKKPTPEEVPAATAETEQEKKGLLGKIMEKLPGYHKAEEKKEGILCGQDDEIAATVHDYVLASIPDLLLQSFLHPIRIFLRSQSITLPLTYAAAAAALLHLPLNCALVFYLCLGIRGVAFASVCTNLNLLLLLVLYIYFSGVHRQTATLDFSIDCFKGWRSLLNLAILSAISVCLEWWWYEIMVLLCGFLLDPKSTVASMGILILIAGDQDKGYGLALPHRTPRHISVEAVLQVVLLLVQGAGCDQLEFSLLHRVKVVWGNRGGATGGFTALVDVPSGSTSATATVASAIREGPLLLSHQLISCGEDMAEATMTGGD
ncbi:hypothetical protein ZIOFF_008221 [Zingiber officinale]|uniref:Uncharacterized protein n=1 Tax=Zingiber officinale TaxID=94328 RepID=A0A8J5I361_ZINOF|nr:hypothetical protein ZIOFF_008221 [Zingiber officinale]